MTDPRFPIGEFRYPESVSVAERTEMIERLASQPSRLRSALQGLKDADYDRPYREGGWTIRQVVHHLPDSHMNSYVRFKLALTEEQPTIKPYEEALWAALPDTVNTPIEASLNLFEALHRRWVTLLRLMSNDQWQRTMNHPVNGLRRLDQVLALYAWHGDHHIAHVLQAR